MGDHGGLCSTHGGSVDVGTSENGFDFGGNFPLTEIQCGTAYNMVVSIEGCTVKTEMHGYVHSDYPFYTFTSSTTIEATVRKSASESQLSFKIYTPQGTDQTGRQDHRPRRYRHLPLAASTCWQQPLNSTHERYKETEDLGGLSQRIAMIGCAVTQS